MYGFFSLGPYPSLVFLAVDAIVVVVILIAANVNKGFAINLFFMLIILQIIILHLLSYPIYTTFEIN